MVAKYTGTCRVYTDIRKLMDIVDCVYVPTASENLLFIPKLEEQGYGARFFDGVSEIFNETDGTIFRRKTEAGKLHYLQMIVVPKDPAKSCKVFGSAAILKKASAPALALMERTQ